MGTQMKSSKSECVSYPEFKMSHCYVTGSRSLTNNVLSHFGRMLQMCGVLQLITLLVWVLQADLSYSWC